MLEAIGRQYKLKGQAATATGLQGFAAKAQQLGAVLRAGGNMSWKDRTFNEAMTLS